MSSQGQRAALGVSKRAVGKRACSLHYKTSEANDKLPCLQRLYGAQKRNKRKTEGKKTEARQEKNKKSEEDYYYDETK